MLKRLVPEENIIFLFEVVLDATRGNWYLYVG